MQFTVGPTLPELTRAEYREFQDMQQRWREVCLRVWRLDQALGSCHQHLWRENQRYRRYRNDPRAYHDDWDPRSLAYYATQYAQILEELASENAQKVDLERRIKALFEENSITLHVGEAIRNI